MNRIESLKWHGFMELGNQDIEPMTRDLSMLFINLTMGENAGEPDFNGKVEEVFGKSFAYQVLDKRLEVHGSQKYISPAVRALCSTLSNSPGDAVMWAFTLAYIQSLEGSVTVSNFVNYFPMGFPSEPTRHRVWDAQKTATGSNMVDNFDNWPQVKAG